MDYKYVVPTSVPASEHPYAGLFLGVVPEGRESTVARHIFDQLGARIQFPDTTKVSTGWAVGVSTLEERHRVEVGDVVEYVIPGAENSAVRIVSGHLPPGVQINKHDGTLTGEFTKPGLFDVTFSIGPAIKLDPLGGLGTPGEPVAWIDIDSPRTKAKSHATIPPSLESLSALELSQLAAEAMRLERLKAVEEIDNGN